MARILLVDDEESILTVLGTLLRAEEYDVVSTKDGEKARGLITSEDFDLMLSDIRMSPVSGMELLKLARDERPDMSVIMLTAYGSVDTAIEAMKLGAFDYIPKPFKVDELLITIQRALEYRHAITEIGNLKAQLETQYQFENIVAESEAMRNVCEMIKKVGPTDTTVLIYGESGTGKELVAKAIHGASRRKNKIFLAVNCAALPEALLESEMFGHVKGAFTGASSEKKGLFEAASGGTLFLDEIGAMPLSIQAKLLRVLQEKEVRRVGGNKEIPVDARILASTNTLLETLMAENKFREDLYYRLSVIPVEIKPLRDRREDILPLVYHIIRQETAEGQTLPSIDREVCAILESYSWLGNVRELENAIKHAITFARENKITKDVLPPKIAATPVSTSAGAYGDQIDAAKYKSLKAFLRSKEEEYLQQILANTAGDRKKAADVLKISLATLYRKLPESENKQ